MTTVSPDSPPDQERERWNQAYAKRFAEQAPALDFATGYASAHAADEAYLGGMSPEEAADEELSYWTDDEEGGV
jgi:hypothetical protein